MHNEATDQSIESFIKQSYLPEVLEQIDLSKHVAFYRHTINEFGPLNLAVYEKVEESDSKLIVHLIKEDESINNQNIDPTEILSVEIDIHNDHPHYLTRGLGLGALACARRKN